jgi:hypothetical protein
MRDEKANMTARVAAAREMLDRVEGKSIMRRERVLGNRREQQLEIGEAHLEVLRNFSAQKLSPPVLVDVTANDDEPQSH